MISDQDPNREASSLAEFEQGLERLASQLPATDDVTGRERVERRRQQRRRRSRGGLALVAAGIVGITGVGLANNSSNESDDLIVTATPPIASTAPTSDGVAAATTTSSSTGPSTTSTPTTTSATSVNTDVVEPTMQRVLDPITVATLDADPVNVSSLLPVLDLESTPGVPASFEVELAWQFLVPWDDGFLLGRTVQIPPDGVQLGVIEARELLGGELLDALFSGWETTKETAAEVLRDQGFGDEGDLRLDAHRDLLEALFSFDWPYAIESYFSPDGLTWEPLDVVLPATLSRPALVASDGDRLAVLTVPARNALPLAEPITVWSTTDLADWTAHEVPVADPFADAAETVADSAETMDPYLSAYVQPERLVVGEGGWGLEVKTLASVDVQAFVSDQFGVELDGYGTQIRNGEVVIDVQQPGQADEEIVIDLEDAGLDEQQAALLERSDITDIWTGNWDSDDGLRLDDLSLFFYGGLTAAGDDIAVWTATKIGIVEPGGAVIGTHPIPDLDYSVSTVIPYGDALLVYANEANSAVLLYELDARSSTWTPIDLERMPDNMPDKMPDKMTVQYGSSGSVLRLGRRSLPPALATMSSIEQDGYRYISVNEPPRNSYEVRRISTDEVVVAENADVREPGFAADQLFEFRTTDIQGERLTVTDPATGDIIIDLGADELADLWASLTQANGSPMPDWTLDDFEPRDSWVMAPSSDGWLLHDLPEPVLDENGNPKYLNSEIAARSGAVVLLQTVDGLLRFELS